MMDNEGRVARVLTKVLRSTLRDAHTDRLILAAPDTPEGGLVQRWCESAAIVLAGAPGENGLRVHPANRTALLLDAVPDTALLVLGDVPASVVALWTGSWTGSEALHALAQDAGGIDALDAALRRWLDERHDFADAMAPLPAAVGEAIRTRFDGGRFARGRAGLVPKLGHRTIGHDLCI